MRNKLFSLCAAGLLAIAASNVSAVMISLVPDGTTKTVGAPFDVALTISGLGNNAAPSLGAFDLDVLFDPAVLAFDSVTFGDPFLGDQIDSFGCIPGFSCDFDNLVAGVLGLFEFSLDTLGFLDLNQPGAFTLATITFTPSAAGSTVVDLSLNNIGDDPGDPLAVDTPISTTLLINAAAVPVPEPGTLLLLAAGLLGLGFKRLHGKA